MTKPFIKTSTNNRPTVSVTKLSTLMMCPRKFYYKYILGMQEEKKYYLTRGAIFHEVIASYLLDREKNPKFFSDMVSAKFAEARLRGEPTSDFKTSESSVMATVEKAVTAYRAEVESLNKFYPLIMSVNNEEKPAVEMEFRIPFVDLRTMKPIEGLDVDLYGFIDLISYDTRNSMSIRDHKLHSKEYDPFIVKTDIQLGLYAYAFMYLLKMGFFPSVKKIDEIEHINTGFNSFLIKRNKDKDIEFSYVNHKITIEEIMQRVKLVSDMVFNMQNMRFTPCYGEHCNFRCSLNEPCLADTRGQDISGFINPMMAEAHKANESRAKSILDELRAAEKEELF